MITVELQSQGHRDLLDAIDKLRSQGLSGMVNLPQIIVCGDQKAGKSSVLGGLSRVPFPTKDTLCTRFATELILRRTCDSQTKFKATVIRAGKDVTDDDVLFTSEEWKADSEIDSDTRSATNFSQDVLRIELSGPDQPHLTLVDLPGLFAAANKDQSDDDAEMVRNLVLHYMQQEGSIILAVVSAKSDFALQSVTKYTRKYDPHGRRTLGVITKPDTLPPGSESEEQYVQLARNEDVKLALGWHVLRNQGFDEQKEGKTFQDRDDAEAAFFKPSGVWAKSLPATQIGVAALRVRLSSVLKDHILSDLPRLVNDVETSITDCQRRLKLLGADSPRSSLPQQRQYLIDLAHKFTNLVQAAIDGNYYHDASFFGIEGGKENYRPRLRAAVQIHLAEFSRRMLLWGNTWKVVEETDVVAVDMEAERKKRSVAKRGGSWDVLENDMGKDGVFSSPVKISREQYMQNVANRMRYSRGCELPGTFNPTILASLFQEQCQPWVKRARWYTLQLVEMSELVVKSMLHHAVFGRPLRGLFGDDEDGTDSDSDSGSDGDSDNDDAGENENKNTMDRIYTKIILPAIGKQATQLKTRVDELLEPHTSGHPITYNHYLTENVQNVQKERQLKAAKTLAGKYFGGVTSGWFEKRKDQSFSLNVSGFVEAVVGQNEPDMEKVACNTATDYMEAYYKVALKKFIDDFSVLAIEQCLVQKLPLLFTPSTVGGLSDDEIRELAAEKPKTVEAREAEQEKLAALQKGLQELKKLGKIGTSLV